MATAPVLTSRLLILVYVFFISAQDQSKVGSVKLFAQFGEKLLLSCTIPHQKNTSIIRWLQKTSSMEQWEEITKLSGVPVDEERFIVFENGTLVILSVSVEDEGQFKCQVVKNGSEVQSITSVAVFKPPTKPMLEMSFLAFTAGTVSEIGTCISGNGYPVSNITWYKSGSVVTGNGNEIQIQEHIIQNQNKLYTIKSTLHYTLSKSDINSKFVCKVVSPSRGGSEVQSSRSIQVDVHYEIERVVIEVNPSEEVIPAGGSINLKCTADSNPPPIEYIWEKDGKQISTSAQYTIQSVTRRDEGEYRCTVFDFNFNKQSAARRIQVQANLNNNELGGEGDIPPIAVESRSGDALEGNRAGMVIGIIVTLSLVAFFVSVAYYLCYYRKKAEKKPLEDFEERSAMDPEKVPAAAG